MKPVPERNRGARQAGFTTDLRETVDPAIESRGRLSLMIVAEPSASAIELSLRVRIALGRRSLTVIAQERVVVAPRAALSEPDEVTWMGFRPGLNAIVVG